MKKYEQLEGWAQTEASIECTECHSSDGQYGMDEIEAIPLFYKRGWRAKGDKCYCPKCMKKLKKNQKKKKF